MNRRNFLSRLGIGTVATVTSAIVPASTQPKELDSGSLRPMCSACKTRMIVRHGEGRPYASCPLTTCKRYGEEISLQPLPAREIPHKLSAKTEQEIMNKRLELFKNSINLTDTNLEDIPELVEYSEKKDARRRTLRTK